MALEGARWYDAEGKEMPRVAAWRALQPEAVVLLSADGQKVDPAYLRLFKEGTLILVLGVEDLPNIPAQLRAPAEVEHGPAKR